MAISETKDRSKSKVT